jgi:hypothetical protein
MLTSAKFGKQNGDHVNWNRGILINLFISCLCGTFYDTEKLKDVKVHRVVASPASLSTLSAQLVVHFLDLELIILIVSYVMWTFQ